MAFGRTVLTTWILFQYFDVVRSWQAVVVKPAVFVRSGSSAELTCTYNTHVSEGFTLEWRYASPGTPAVQAKRLLYYNGRVFWVNSWDGRMALVQNPPVSGVASIRIVSAQTSDAGLYICEVTNPNDWSGSGQGLINLTVLVPPSVPVCQLQGNTYVGNYITLICQSSQGLPTPIYSWHREQNVAALPADSFIEDQRTGSLILRNLSEAFASTYTCKASNELGQAVCSITLRMTYEGRSAAAIGGVLMGVFFVLLLIGVTFSYVTWNTKKHIQKIYANELSQVNNNSAPHQQSGGKVLPIQLDTEDQSDLKVSHFSPLV
ncbi:V-set and immunoglobulin domain-containing protein 2-like [Megalobrama amblycephala]|uniref:V-set and immunoglobulin domain-containing protein 2-like n=1 Tax=Megalobrama amblycephala TaxID=75352 RepID=UPI00201431D1|nr:V-set and immunoglobulin domain-containing protein 2-like [Megalobrama amblycephala]